MTQPAGGMPVGVSAGQLRASVVICTYTLERWPQLEAAVASVSRQLTPSDELIVVVDHNEALLARAREAWTHLAAVSNSERRGLSGARNTGAARARGQVVAFLDDDAVAAPDWLERITAAHRDPQRLAVGGRIEPRWTTRRPAWFPEEFDWVVGCTYRGMPEAAADVRNVIGANMAFRRDVLRESGGFRSDLGRVGDLPVGCEETELCVRVQRLRPGGRVHFDPAIAVCHDVPGDRATLRYYLSRCYSEGMSKAAVARLSGAGSLTTERRYVTRVLPAAVVRGVGELVLGGRPTGASRAGAVVLGLAATGAGYLRGRRLQPSRS